MRRTLVPTYGTCSQQHVRVLYRSTTLCRLLPRVFKQAKGEEKRVFKTPGINSKNRKCSQDHGFKMLPFIFETKILFTYNIQYNKKNCTLNQVNFFYSFIKIETKVNIATLQSFNMKERLEKGNSKLKERGWSSSKSFFNSTLWPM